MAAMLLLVPGVARADAFCPPPSPPPGAGFPPGGRVFHGPVTIHSLRIGRSAPMPCRMSGLREDPSGAAEASCGSYRLSYTPWDPYPRLTTLVIKAPAQGARPALLRTGQGRSAAVIRCDRQGLVVTTIGERTLRVRTTRDLVLDLPDPLDQVVIRESFESSYPLVPIQGAIPDRHS